MHISCYDTHLLPLYTISAIIRISGNHSQLWPLHTSPASDMVLVETVSQPEEGLPAQQVTDVAEAPAILRAEATQNFAGSSNRHNFWFWMRPIGLQPYRVFLQWTNPSCGCLIPGATCSRGHRT